MIFFKKCKILVVAAHPDDELLGSGATLHRLIEKEKAQVRSIIMSKGITSRKGLIEKKQISAQEESIKKAAKIIGIKKTTLFDFPDNRFDSVDLLDFVKRVEEEISDFKPDIIFTHHGMDLNIDHRKVFQSVLTASRPLPGSSSVSLLTFETPSSTEWQVQENDAAFLPNFYYEVSNKDIKSKQKALESYVLEVRKYPHPRSSRSLEIIARRWGTVIGVEFAEAFRIIRLVKKNK